MISLVFLVSGELLSFLYRRGDPIHLHSFPTRRSSDLVGAHRRIAQHDADAVVRERKDLARQDRKSTRLNSSHVKISYAVFCLKKKKTAPDLILVTQDCYKGGTSIDELVSDVPLDVLSKLSGVHRMDGIILAQGPHTRRNTRSEGANFLDVAPTVMYTHGMPIPSDSE